MIPLLQDKDVYVQVSAARYLITRYPDLTIPLLKNLRENDVTGADFSAQNILWAGPKDLTSVSGRDEIDPVARVKRRAAERLLQVMLKKLISPGRLARIVLELSSNVVPGADIVGDAALAADIADLTQEAEAAIAEGDVAADFVESEPDLDSVRVADQEEHFPSFYSFKKSGLEKRFGPAGRGYEYHHIVEQNGPNSTCFDAEQRQSTVNIVRVPTDVHRAISAIFEKYWS